MGKIVWPEMYLTPRDKRLFEYLFLNKIATVSQINRDIFGNDTLKGLSRRLRALVRQGHLRRTATGEEGTRFAYFLSDKTFEKYIAHRTERQWAQLKSDSPDHDLVLVDIRNRISKSPKVASYFTENAIEAGLMDSATFPADPFLEMHSDAAIMFRASQKLWNIAIEYEDAQKTKERYASHLNSYCLKKEIHVVLYIVKEPALRNLLSELDRGLCQGHSSKIFFGLLSDVLESDKNLHFPNNTGNLLQLD